VIYVLQRLADWANANDNGTSRPVRCQRTHPVLTKPVLTKGTTSVNQSCSLAKAVQSNSVPGKTETSDWEVNE
jgi:hypothetical protein